VARLPALGVRAAQSTQATAMALKGTLRFLRPFDFLALPAGGVEAA